MAKSAFFTARLLSFLLLLTSQITLIEAQPTVAQQTTDSATTHIYAILSGTHNYLDALTLASQMPAQCGEQPHLLTISDQQEQDFIFTFTSGDIWIGYDDRASEGSFVWVTGETTTYTNWSPSEPNNSGGDEDAALMSQFGGTWNDLPTSGHNYKVVIEWDCGSTPPSPGAGGDPHFKLFNGKSFDFHGHCDLLLLDTTLADGARLMIQVRSSPYKEIFSYISEAAIQIDDHVLTIGSSGQHSIDGVPQVVGKTEPLAVDEVRRYPVQSSKAKRKPRYVYKIHLGNGPHGKEEIDIREYKNWITISILHPSASNMNKSKGLLGRFPDGALVGKDGKLIHTNYDDFGQDWQVPPGESLLGPGPFSDSCAPSQALETRRHRRLQESSITRAQATKACEHWGNQMEDCINDVQISGDLEMANAGPV